MKAKLWSCLAVMLSLAAAATAAKDKAYVSPAKAHKPSHISSLARKASRDLPVLSLTDSGQQCVDYLKKGGRISSKKRNMAIAGASTLSASLVITCAVTAPFLVGIFLIPVAGAAVTCASIPAIGVIKYHHFAYNFGKLIESSYIVAGLKEAKGEKLENAHRRLKRFRDKKQLKHYPASEKSLKEIAETIVKSNEAGYFCPKKVFGDPKSDLPYYIGKIDSPYHVDKIESPSLAPLCQQVENGTDPSQDVVEFRRYFQAIGESKTIRQEENARAVQELN